MIPGLIMEVPEPRAVIVALHGGAVNARYFDAPGYPRHSLLRLGSSLGYTVIALNRPGYEGTPSSESPAERVSLTFAAIDSLLEDRPRGAGLFLVGHSAGCMLATRMAAADPSVLGVELAGTGLHHHPLVRAAFEERKSSGVVDLIWYPASSYSADSLRDRRILSASPLYEAVEGRRWWEIFPDIAAQVRVPVRYSLGEHERVWRAGPAALAEVAALFTASPRVVTHEQATGGHNLSLGLSATAYHLSMLSFAEECVLDRAAGGARSEETA
jgi:pimeloyl-ACP methyl ester carboxylesterase